MGWSFTRWAGSKLGDLTGTNAAANASEKQTDAAVGASKDMIAEAEKSRDFIKQQADQGIAYIDRGTNLAAGNILYGGDQAALYNSEGRDAALADLMSGNLGARSDLLNSQSQAAGALQKGGNRLADLYAGGLAENFQADPGYQFRQQQGEQAINRSAAARGGRLGGSTLKALAEYNSGLASDEFNRYAQRQIGMAGSADQSDMMRGSALAGLYSNTGGQLAAGESALGQQRAGVDSGWGTNMANLATGTYGNLANIYSSAGNNMANVGIGAATSSAQLTPSIMNAIGMPVQYAGAADNARAQGQGQVFQLGLLGALAASDERLKTNIVPATDDLDDLLAALQPYSFEYKSGEFGSGTHIGVMAQDLEKSKAGREIVVDTPNGKMLDLRKLAGVTIAAAATERKKRLALEERIAALEAKIGAA